MMGVPKAARKPGSAVVRDNSVASDQPLSASPDERINVTRLRQSVLKELMLRRVCGGPRHAYSDHRGGEPSIYGTTAVANIYESFGLSLGNWANRAAWAAHILSFQRDDSSFVESDNEHATCMAIQALNILGWPVDRSIGHFAPLDQRRLAAFVERQEWQSTHKALWGMTAPLIAGDVVDAAWIAELLWQIENNGGMKPPLWCDNNDPPWKKISSVYHIIMIYDCARAPYPDADAMLDELLALNWPKIRARATKTHCTDADWACLLTELVKEVPSRYEEVREAIRSVSRQRVAEWLENETVLAKMSSHHIYCHLWSTAFFQSADRGSFVGPFMLDTLNLPSLFRVMADARDDTMPEPVSTVHSGGVDANQPGIEMNLDRQFRIARVWSNHELRRISPFFRGLVVNASAGTDEDKEGGYYRDYFIAADGYELTNNSPGAFRGFSGRENEHLVDLLDELPSSLRRRYDVVFNHTTLEHIFEVNQAFGNLCGLSKDIVIAVVPFAQVQHDTSGYEDFWRFLPNCMRRLFEANGLSVIYESASPYTDSAIYLFFVGSRSPKRWKGTMPSYTPLSNVGDWIGRPNTSARRSYAQMLGKIRGRALSFAALLDPRDT